MVLVVIHDIEQLTAPVAAIRARIATLGLTQDVVARAAHIDQSLVSRYLRGLRPLNAERIERLNTALDRLEAEERAADEARARVRAELAAEEREVLA